MTREERRRMATPGTHVAVPACSVGEVETVETIVVAGEELEAVRIRLKDGAQLWVPVGRLADRGIRLVMREEDIARALEVAGRQVCPAKRPPWNRRRRRYEELLRSNEAEKLGELLGALVAARNAKGTLSFGERRLYEKVAEQIATELAIRRGIEPDEAAALIEAALEDEQAA